MYRTSRRRFGSSARVADALLLGRVTFEQVRGYWPLQTDDTTGITDYLNDVSKYVLSNTLHDPEWSARWCCGASTTSER
jgi:dihydrofolate reductase